MTLFRLDASINPAASASRAIADIVESEWLAENPDGTVVKRGLLAGAVARSAERRLAPWPAAPVGLSQGDTAPAGMRRCGPQR